MRIKLFCPGVPCFRFDTPSAVRALFALFLLVLPSGSSADVRQWTGAVSANWSNPNNWNPAGAPVSGDSLRFDGGGNHTMLNDVPNLTLWELAFMGGDFVLNGNPINLTNVNSSSVWVTTYGGSITINCALILTAKTEFQVWPYYGSSGSLRLNADVNLNGNDLYLYCFAPGAGSSAMQLAGSFSGNGDVHASASGQPDGTIEFLGTADNTFSGTLFLQPNVPSSAAGIYFNKQAGAVVTNRLVLSKAEHLYWRAPHQVGDHATVVVQDGSRLDLDGYDESIGTLIVTNVHADAEASIISTAGSGFGPPMGTLTINDGVVTSVDNASVLPTIQGVVNLPPGLHSFFNYSSGYAALDLQAQIIGAGGFIKFGNGALLLKGTNSFGGTVRSSEGIIDVYNANGFGSPAGGVVLDGGSVTLRGVTIASEPLTARGQAVINAETVGSLLFSVGSSGWTGPITLETNLVLGGADISLTGPISGAGGLDFRNFGTAIIAGADANTFTGPSLVRCPLLQLNKPIGLSAFSGPLVVGGGSGGPYEARWLNYFQQPNNVTLTISSNGVVNLNGQVDDFGPVFMNGGLIETGVGSFICYAPITANAAPTTALITGSLSLSYAPAVLIVSNGLANPGLQINATISGADIRKYGQGTLLLTAANTFSGYLFVSEGIVHADNNQAFGGLNGNTIVADGATIRLGGIDGMNESFQLNGSGFQGTNGALQVSSGGTMFGGVFLSNPATINVLQGAGLAINSVISGSGPLTKKGPGNLYLGGVSGGAGNNTYSGGTIVAEGPLYLSKSQNVIAAPGLLTIGPGTVSLPATATWVYTGMMAYGGAVTVNGNSLLLLNGNNQALGQLTLNDGGRVVTGAGVLSFSAGATINNGTLNAPQIGLRGSASITGNVSLPDLDHVTFNVMPYSDTSIFTTTPEFDVPANISGFGDIFKQGQGRMRFSGSNTFNNSPPTSAGNVQVLQGTLIAASPNALGGTGGATFVDTSGTLALDGGVTISGEPLGLFSTNAPGFISLSGSNTWAGDIRLWRDSMIGVNSGSSMLINGTIFGAGNLTKINRGPLTLGGTANNTYSGDTFVNEGTLVLDKVALGGVTTIPHHLTIGNGQAANNPTLLQRDENCINGSVTVNHGGLWTLMASESFSDVELGGRAPLTLNGNAQVQTIITSNSSAYLMLPPGGGVVVNPGSNTTATISGGITLWDGFGTVSARPFTVNAGADQSGQPECLVTASIEAVFSPPPLLQKEGAGTLRLTGTNSFGGTNLVNGGTFWVDGVQPQSPVHLNAGTSLKGSGTVGNINLIGSSATIAPGASPGILTCSNLNATGTGTANLEIELNGTAPGAGYDQINVRGTVNLSGITLKPTLGFASSINDQFIIINNDGTDSVTGTFIGLTPGKKLYIGKELFQITYAGGSGNDVVLARLVTPPPPTLMIERVAPALIRLLWATNDPPFTLQTTTNLPAGPWLPASPLPTVIGTNNIVTNSVIGTSSQFYRLSNP